ncbi:hypothetical protein [Microbispora sp. NPDC046933]|uniref:hypothetical protein n=1 Tax=Microbispora sp. NPDC046933 TaxID=3155618 RepID=UPI0033C33DCA
MAGWFTLAWGGCSAKTFSTRLTALGSACGYWRQQEWLAGDPSVRLRPRPVPPDNSKALTRSQVATVLPSTPGCRPRRTAGGRPNAIPPGARGPGVVAV